MRFPNSRFRLNVPDFHQCRRQSCRSLSESLALLWTSVSSHSISFRILPSACRPPSRHPLIFPLVSYIRSGQTPRVQTQISRTPSSARIAHTTRITPTLSLSSVVSSGNTTHRAPLGHPHRHRLTHNTQRRAGYRPPRGPALSRRGARHYTFNARPAPFSTRTQSSSFQTGRSILPHWILHHKGRFRRV